MGKTGPVPSGCGANRAILRSRPQRWARHSPRARPCVLRIAWPDLRSQRHPLRECEQALGSGDDLREIRSSVVAGLMNDGNIMQGMDDWELFCTSMECRIEFLLVGVAGGGSPRQLSFLLGICREGM
jgi:hypothetical protein